MNQTKFKKLFAAYGLHLAERRKMTRAELDFDNRKLDAMLIGAVRGKDVLRAESALVTFALRLQDGAALTPTIRQWLAQSLIAMVANPEKAAHCFGLTAKRGRPRVAGDELIKALLRVEELQRDSVPLNDNNEGDGAFTIAARESKAAGKSGVGEETIAKEWKAHRNRMGHVRDKAGENSVE